MNIEYILNEFERYRRKKFLIGQGIIKEENEKDKKLKNVTNLNSDEIEEIEYIVDLDINNDLINEKDDLFDYYEKQEPKNTIELIKDESAWDLEESNPYENIDQIKEKYEIRIDKFFEMCNKNDAPIREELDLYIECINDYLVDEKIIENLFKYKESNNKLFSDYIDKIIKLSNDKTKEIISEKLKYTKIDKQILSLHKYFLKKSMNETMKVNSLKSLSRIIELDIDTFIRFYKKTLPKLDGREAYEASLLLEKIAEKNEDKAINLLDLHLDSDLSVTEREYKQAGVMNFYLNSKKISMEDKINMIIKI